MRKIVLTPLELVLMLCLAMMTAAAIYGALKCKDLASASQFWHHQYTNSVIIKP